MGEHEKYGGSTIELTSLCPGSAKARQEIGETPSGKAAERGTRIHKRIEELFHAPTVLQTPLKDDEELIAQGVLTTLVETAAEHGVNKSDIEIEKKVLLWVDAGGKLDYGAFRIFGDMFIADCKSGFNQVMAESNMQMLFYGVGYLKSLDPFIAASLKNAHFVILQPSTEPPYEVTVRKWTIPIEELRSYEGYFKSVIDKTEANPDLRVAGDHCEAGYCPARATCSVYIEHEDQRSHGAFRKLLAGEKTSPARGQQLADQLAVVPLIEKWCEAVKADAKLVLMQDSAGVPGWTLRDGLGNRAWKDEKAVIALAKELGLKPDEYNPRHMIGPKPFEDLIIAKKRANLLAKEVDVNLDPLVDRPNLGAKLAKAKIESLSEMFSGALIK